MTIKLEFDSVKEFAEYSKQDVLVQKSEIRRMIANLGYFLQNIAPSYEDILHKTGTFIILNVDELQDTQNWERIHKRAREELNLNKDRKKL